ncbi:MAG: hypothetical protein HC945_03470 [Nitrosarchaeum sp.]|nr:hypothetical protein [Nitrosarchaeum sp.]
MNRKRIQWFRYFSVLILTTATFVTGLALGNILTQEKLSTLSSLEQDLRLNTLGVELQYSILAEEPCAAINTTTLTDELYSISEKLTFMENQLGVTDPDVVNLKEYYSLLQVRHWLLMQRTREECNQNATLIQYFYSNAGDCDDCEQQGYILTYLRRKYPDVRVYPYDINLDNPALTTLRDLYDIHSAPSLVIDGTTYKHFLTRTELELILEEKDLATT